MFARIAGVPVYHESRGRGLPLVCIHGYGVDHRSIKSGLESVADDIDGLERIYFDLPGMGRSGVSPHILTSDDMLEMVCGFIDQYLGDDREFALAGYSYGGYLARGVLDRMPERVKGVMLLCPVTRFRRSARKLPGFNCCERDVKFYESLKPAERRDMDGFITVQNRAVWEQYLAHIHPSLDLADPALMARIQDTELSRDPDRGPGYGGPALMLLGRYDVSVGYEDALAIAHRFPDGDVVVAGRAGHLLHFEQPWLFRAHVQSWAGRVLDNFSF